MAALFSFGVCSVESEVDQSAASKGCSSGPIWDNIVATVGGVSEDNS
jgi:hypothetical protein